MSKDVSGSPRIPRNTTYNPKSEKERNKEFPLYDSRNLAADYAEQNANGSQMNGILYYQGSGYYLINTALRTNTVAELDDDFQYAIEDMDTINYRMKNNSTLKRGVRALKDGDDPSTQFINSFFDMHANKSLVGARWKDKAFVSTSAGDTSFIREGSDVMRSIEFNIRVRKGKRIIIPDPNRWAGVEKEIILNRGSVFTVAGSRYGKNKDTLIIDLDVE